MAGRYRRRRPGIYVARTRKHANPLRREIGYVGKSVHVPSRQRDHLGIGRWGAAAKSWSDLDPNWHVLSLPWWLGWKWVLIPLEFLAIRLLLPRYNVTHNLGNPRRIPPYRAAMQRAQRDAGGRLLRHHRQDAALEDFVLRVSGAALLVAGALMGIRGFIQ